jgi:hypothetical protein
MTVRYGGYLGQHNSVKKNTKKKNTHTKNAVCRTLLFMFDLHAVSIGYSSPQKGGRRSSQGGLECGANLRVRGHERAFSTHPNPYI